MYRPQTIFRVQIVVLMTLGVLSFIYLLFYRPLTHREAERDRAITAIDQRLLALNTHSRSSLGLDFETVQGNRRLAELSLAAMERAARRARERISLAEEWKDRVGVPFQLLDYDSKRLQLIDELRHAAQAKGVVLEPAVPQAYPEHQLDMPIPERLWAELFVADQILLAAVANNPKTIKSASLCPIKTHRSVDGGRNVLDEYFLRIELGGPAEAALNFLRSLPLTSEELKEAGLPVSSTAKPALFLNRFILKRDLSDPNGVTLDAVVSGLVARDLSAKPSPGAE
jgi:hypothetical protein